MSHIASSTDDSSLGDKRKGKEPSKAQQRTAKRIKELFGSSVLAKKPSPKFAAPENSQDTDVSNDHLPVIGGFTTKNSKLMEADESKVDPDEAFRASLRDGIEIALKNERNIRLKQKAQIQSQKDERRKYMSEPALLWRNNPFEAPVFAAARRFFTRELSASAFAPFTPPPNHCMTKEAYKLITQIVPDIPPSFTVFANQLKHWRVVAKLAVRSYGLVEEYARMKAQGLLQRGQGSNFNNKGTEKLKESDSVDDFESVDEVQEDTQKSQKNLSKPSVNLEQLIRSLTKVERQMLDAGYERPQIGMFKSSSREIAPNIELNPSHVPCINKGITAIIAAISACKITGYNDITGAGELRYLSLNACVSPPLRNIRPKNNNNDKSKNGKKGGEERKKNTPVDNDEGESSDEEDKESDPIMRKLKEYASPEDSGKVELTIVWNLLGKSNEEKPKTFDTPKMTKLGDGIVGLNALMKLDKRLAEFVLEVLKTGMSKKNSVKVNERNLPDVHPLWHSLHINFQNAWSHTNTIFSFDPSSWLRIFGPPALVETLPMIAARSPPQLTQTFTASKRFHDSVENEEQKNRNRVVLNPKMVRERNSEIYSKCSIEDKSRPIVPIHFFPPQVFRQANYFGFARIVSRIRMFIPEESHCVELYGGVGTIGLNLLDRFSSYVCSDENKTNQWCFEESLSVMHPALRHEKAVKYLPFNATTMVNEGALCTSQLTNRDVFKASEEDLRNFNSRKRKGKGKGRRKDKASLNAGKDKHTDKQDELKKEEDPLAMLRSLKSKSAVRDTKLPNPNVCIVDPPRKGLDIEVLDALCASKSVGEGNKSRNLSITTLVYISCGFDSFKSDCERLVKPLEQGGGGWRIVHSEGHALFPGANHIETFAVFVRN